MNIFQMNVMMLQLSNLMPFMQCTYALRPGEGIAGLANGVVLGLGESNRLKRATSKNNIIIKTFLLCVIYIFFYIF